MSDHYIPSPSAWVREQVEAIEATGDTRAVSIMDRPVVMLTMRGRKTGALRKVPLMRVEHDGVYAAVASKGGAPDHPVWYRNLLAHPRITLQDGTRSWTAVAREVTGEEYALFLQTTDGARVPAGSTGSPSGGAARTAAVAVPPIKARLVNLNVIIPPLARFRAVVAGLGGRLLFPAAYLAGPVDFRAMKRPSNASTSPVSPGVTLLVANPSAPRPSS